MDDVNVVLPSPVPLTTAVSVPETEVLASVTVLLTIGVVLV